MMKRTKKGITLVELVICCAIIVLLGGACTAVLVSGQTVFDKSSKTANAQLDADVLQTYLSNMLPSAKAVRQIGPEDIDNEENKNCIYFDGDGKFTLKVNGNTTTIRSVSEFAYSVIRAGDPASTNARAQLVYTVTLTDGSTFNGGFILSNVKYSDVVPDEASEITDDKASENPLCFDLPAEPEETT